MCKYAVFVRLRSACPISIGLPLVKSSRERPAIHTKHQAGAHKQTIPKLYAPRAVYHTLCEADTAVVDGGVYRAASSLPAPSTMYRRGMAYAVGKISVT